MANDNMDYKEHNKTYDKVFITGLMKVGTIVFIALMAMVVYFTNN
jgi:Bacterial aa3 type cytochrome c oxidase subunit IV